MILSMTGYGKSIATFQDKKINVEIKSLNSKALDLSTRIAPLYREKEMEMRQMIQQKVIRGKVDFSIWIEKVEDEMADAASINIELAKNYYQQLTALASSNNEATPSMTEMMPIILRMPDILVKQDQTEILSEEEWAVARQAIDSALDALVDFRRQEGEALAKKFGEKIDNIEALLKSIEPYENSRVEKIRQRIIDGLKQISEIDYDKNRLEQELIYYIEKLDISEEKQRLTNHLNYFRETMAEPEGGQGKKLGFIAQEMGREINTTGSKSNQAEMQNIVVKMKDELEQIKEQVLNAM